MQLLRTPVMLITALIIGSLIPNEVRAHRFQLTKVFRVEEKGPCGKPFAQR